MSSFEDHGRSPLSLSRHAAIKRAEAELARTRPRIEEYIKAECLRLEQALLAARERDEDYASFVADAYTASQNLRDVAGSVGYPLIGFVAANLCTIIETADAVQMQYPASVIDCFFEALRLVQGRDYVEKTPKDLPHLTAGLLQTVELTKAMAVRTAQSAKQAS
jgi:hypothetical protein